ncbi:unnamed protein product [Blepharisma stoltei]|uniref:Alpha/beta hydrolase n=1 Tax=Blepharisma stoltei TaxID=1481888 RepID=A0AAU9JTD0_9CILI|nr:unnamed protein product [Blepharisma stoltei]
MEYFTNRNGLQLACNLSIKYPDDKKIYIVCALYPSEIFFFSDFVYQHLDANVCKLDLTGEGRSQGERVFYKYTKDADDLDDTVKFLTSKGYSVDGIIGASKYGTSVILYAGLYGEVKNIISVSPKFNMSEFPDFLSSNFETLKNNGEIVYNAFGEDWNFTWEMIREVQSIDMKKICERARGNIYVIYGLEDQFCPYLECLELAWELNDKCKGTYSFDCDHCLIGILDEVLEIIERVIS